MAATKQCFYPLHTPTAPRWRPSPMPKDVDSHRTLDTKMRLQLPFGNFLNYFKTTSGMNYIELYPHRASRKYFNLVGSIDVCVLMFAQITLLRRGHGIMIWSRQSV